MKTRRLIQNRICPDVRASRDHRDGQWHAGWRMPESLRTAFYYGRKWWAIPAEEGTTQGPYKSKEEALAL